VKETVKEQIEDLRKRKTKELRALYEELFGEESRSSNQAHLFRRIAWRLQAQAEGDLSERARKRAEEIAKDADLRLRAPRPFWQKEGSPGSTVPAPGERRDARLPPAGTVLTRTHEGKKVEVTVRESSFEYKGKRYRSLSLIAQRVTGTRWNGYSFFGLKKEWLAKASGAEGKQRE
jgi:DUF2924 family protein